MRPPKAMLPWGFSPADWALVPAQKLRATPILGTIFIVLFALAPGAAFALPTITSVPASVLAGDSFEIDGSGFSAAPLVNFFVASSAGPLNYGPLVPSTISANALTVALPTTIVLGQGVAAIQVVNTDEGYAASNVVTTQLFGDPAFGFSNVTKVNGMALADTSTDPDYSVDNVETVVSPGSTLTLAGNGYDTNNGVAIDLFCACPGGKVGPFFISPGTQGFTSTSISLTIPSSGVDAPVTGPGSLVVSNRGTDGSYSIKSNAVSVPVGALITAESVTQEGCTVTVVGAGFSPLTVINLFNQQPGRVVNLGGLIPDGSPAISLNVVDSNRFTFEMPPRIVPGPAYVQAINPPFLPYTSTGNAPGGTFSAASCTMATPTPSPTATLTPTATPTRSPTATLTRTATATPSPTPGPTPIVTSRIFVSEQCPPAIAAFPVGSSGDVAPLYPLTGLCEPHAIARDSNGKIYVAVTGGILVYAPGSSGNVPPVAVITSSLPEGVALDSAGNIYVTSVNDEVLVYPAGSNGKVSPIRIISGMYTGLSVPVAISLDSSGNIYVTNQGNNTVTVYSAGSNGDTAPTAIIGGPNTGLDLTGGSSIALTRTREIYVVNRANNSITAYAAGSTGNATPVATISGPSTQLISPSGIALDSSGNLCVTNIITNATPLNGIITVYAPASNGDATPVATVSGPDTGLGGPSAITVDKIGNLYVTNYFTQSINVYSAGSKGDASPSATIGSSSGLYNPQGPIALDLVGNIYVEDYSVNVNESIKVYSAQSGADAPPIAIIEGASTGLSSAVEGIALDRHGKIYVSLYEDSVVVYPAGMYGDVAPIATISGSKTGLSSPGGIAVDAAGRIYVANQNNDSITIYAAGSNGNVLPSATISGSKTVLSPPIGIALDATGKIYVLTLGYVTVYPTGSDGNVAPIAEITSPQFDEPRAIALDSAANVYIVQSASVLVFPHGSNGETFASVIAGPHTLLGNAVGIAVGP